MAAEGMELVSISAMVDLASLEMWKELELCKVDSATV